MNAKPLARFHNIAAIALVGWLLGPLRVFAAVSLPGPALPLDPLVSNDLTVLKSQYVAFASALGDFENQTDVSTTYPLSWKESILHAGSVSAIEIVNPAVSSFAEFAGRTQVGRLSAKTHAWVENGSGTGSATMTLQFMDLLQVGTGGVLDFKWSVSGTADEQVWLPSVGAGSSITAELFVWQYGFRPVPGMPFAFTNYAKSDITAAGAHHLLPQSFRYPAGSRWWVLGQLTIQSRATGSSLLRVLPPHMVETTADFSHTVELFIEPGLATPEASFHSASGYDYRPAAIPEPASGLLLIGGLLMLRLFAARRA